MNNIEVGMRVRVTLHHHVTDIDHEAVPLYPLQLTQIGPRAFVTPWEPPIKVVATAGTIYEGVVDEVYSEPGENLFWIRCDDGSTEGFCEEDNGRGITIEQLTDESEESHE